jgi:hypothetical protein
VEELAAFANVSVDVIKSAIKLRQQHMMKEIRTPPLKSTSFQKKKNYSSSTTKNPSSHLVKSSNRSKKEHKVYFISFRQLKQSFIFYFL